MISLAFVVCLVVMLNIQMCLKKNVFIYFKRRDRFIFDILLRCRVSKPVTDMLNFVYTMFYSKKG